jgi:adenosylhomocysteinase
MDMSFSTQALCAEWVVKSAKRPEVRVHDVPAEIEDWVSRLKLESMGIRIDELTGEQKEYLSSWKIGT